MLRTPRPVQSNQCVIHTWWPPPHPAPGAEQPVRDPHLVAPSAPRTRCRATSAWSTPDAPLHTPRPVQSNQCVIHTRWRWQHLSSQIRALYIGKPVALNDKMFLSVHASHDLQLIILFRKWNRALIQLFVYIQ